MKSALTIARRELGSSFNSPLAYIFISSFLVISGIFFFFVGGFFAAGQASLRGYFGLMPVLMAVLVPALTMRLWAEERRQGTYETLVTLPMSDWALIMGKHLAVLGVLGITFALSLPLVWSVGAFGAFDPGVIFSEYFGLLLLASASAAVGQLISSLTRNQMTAFIATALVLLALNLIYQVGLWIALPEWLSGALNWLSLGFHYASFSRGVLDTRDILYFVIINVLALYLCAKNLAFGKWS